MKLGIAAFADLERVGQTSRKKPELLAPAGDMEKLQIAIAYGADAVYLSGKSFGLRAKAKNFDMDGVHSEMAQAIEYAHAHGVKVYITANIFAHNEDLAAMKGCFSTMSKLGADAFIISDPGVLALAKEEAPGVEIHLSTQANTTNYAAAEFWYRAGVKRVILARELSLNEIKELREKSPAGLQLEAFVHGAVCMSYSGRCMLSRYMSGRDANLGACAHPCRYQYRLWAEEITRPGQFMPVLLGKNGEEDSESAEIVRGMEIFSPEDLCMAAFLPEMLGSGITSLKIEGRMKTQFYVGLAVKAYREAIDDLYESEELYRSRVPYYLELLNMPSHRGFSTGFYFERPDSGGAVEYQRSHDFVGIVRDYKEGIATIEQRGVFEEYDELLFVLKPGDNGGKSFSQRASDMQNQAGVKITRAPHAKELVLMPVSEPVSKFDLVARKAK